MLDALEDRFRAPPGWSTGTFVNPTTGHTIYYGWAAPENPKAIVVGLGGLSEFSEKYFELAHDMLARGYAFWTMDWAYQGRSSRMAAPRTQRRHSDGYDTDIADLHDLITRFVRPFSTAPLLLIAHSMGGNIGLRYLSTHTDIFDAAALSAPFLGIKKITGIDKILLAVLRRLTPDNYVPGGKDWQEKSRISDGSGLFSSDPLRDKIHNAYSLSDDVLQIGSPTIRWVYESLHSAAIIASPGTLEKIQIPVLVAMAGRDDIVSNKDITAAASRLKNGRLLVLDGARHEILMEKDKYRGAFLNGFDKMLEDYKIGSHAEEEDVMEGYVKNKDRLSDRIMFALELSIKQQDLEVSELLSRAMDLAMTRNTGGGEFVERRDYSREIERMLNELRDLKKK